jgi:hypothetical protein
MRHRARRIGLRDPLERRARLHVLHVVQQGHGPVEIGLHARVARYGEVYEPQRGVVELIELLRGDPGGHQRAQRDDREKPAAGRAKRTLHLP